MKPISIIVIFLFITGCSSSQLQTDESDRYAVFTMENASTVGTTMAGQVIKLGGFSGLQFIEEKNDGLYFQTISDRGPNSPTVNSDRPFLLPEYSPMLITIKADLKTSRLVEVSKMLLKKKNGSPLTGLSNSRSEENPLDIFGLINSIDSEGLDTEGLVSDGEGGWWVADEYGPSLALFNQEGKMQRRLTPENELPRQYFSRRPNRGFEAVAKNGSKIYGFLQSPLEKGIDYSPIVEVDTNTSKTSAEYFYTFEKGNDKIGDAVHFNANKFLVIEQNGKKGEQAQKAIYQIELGETDNPVKKTLVVDLARGPLRDVEKVEGVAIIDRKRIAVTYDNDFQIAGATDFKTGITPLNQLKNQLVIIDVNLD